MGEFNNKEQVENTQIEIKSPEQAKRYLNLANSHMMKSRAYERQANTLENQIHRMIQPERKMAEVRSLRRMAESEKKEAEKYKRYAEAELRKPIGELANEFGEQTEKNKSDLSKIKEGNDENKEMNALGSDTSVETVEEKAKNIVKEIADISTDEMAKKFDLSEEEKNILSETDSTMTKEISFQGLRGYKKGSCSGKQIPIYD